MAGAAKDRAMSDKTAGLLRREVHFLCAACGKLYVDIQFANAKSMRNICTPEQQYHRLPLLQHDLTRLKCKPPCGYFDSSRLLGMYHRSETSREYRYQGEQHRRPDYSLHKVSLVSFGQGAQPRNLAYQQLLSAARHNFHKESPQGAVLASGCCAHFQQRVCQYAVLRVEEPSQRLVILVTKIGAHAHVPRNRARDSR